MMAPDVRVALRPDGTGAWVYVDGVRQEWIDRVSVSIEAGDLPEVVLRIRTPRVWIGPAEKCEPGEGAA